MTPALRALPSLPAMGEVVGSRFEILDELGSGGMGHVYRVHDRERQREIALKLIVPRYIGRPDREQRFFREASLGGRVRRHPHIVKILESGRFGDHCDWPFVTMELVEGWGLPTYLAVHGAMVPRRAVTIARQVADAIMTMHADGVAHRDVSTTNMILQDDGVVIIDFSHAGDLRAPRVAAGEGGRLTQPHDMIGTHTCMAPEQARADPPSATMDVYAFGIVLFELLTGHNPYEDTARDSFLPLLVEGKVPPPRIKDESIPQALVELVTACTKLDPAKRPSVPSIVEQLERVLATMGMPVTATVTEVRRAAGPGVASVAAAPSPEVTAPAANGPAPSSVPRPDGWRTIAIVAVACTFVAVGVAVWSYLHASADGQAAAATVEGTGSTSDDGGEESTGAASPTVAPADAAAGAETSVGTSTPIEPASDDDTTTRGQPPPEEPIRASEDDGPTRPQPKPRPAAPKCDDDPRRASQADSARDWSTVVRATRHAECWPSQSARIALRARALLNLRRYRECAALPKRHANDEAKRTITFCAAAAERE
jgi:Protein kinase domain